MSNTLSVKSKQSEGKEIKAKKGCNHYARKCAFVAPCCSKVYTCRVCHDESENHEIDRKLIKKIKCLICHLEQLVHNKCDSCNTIFGKYYCEHCRLFDDAEKGQFHCNGCGLCRIGGRENFFHCEKCDMCLSIKLKGQHKCVEEGSRRNCPICLEDLHTSRTNGHIPPCGHLIHSTCFEQCVKTGNYACPTCAESLLNMKSVWDQLDGEVANTPMPEEYKQFYVFVLCRDCHKESKVLFHVIGLKCSHCGSYNTCRTADNEEPDAESNSSESGASNSPVGSTARNQTVPLQSARNETEPPQAARHETVPPQAARHETVPPQAARHETVPPQEQDPDEPEGAQSSSTREAASNSHVVDTAQNNDVSPQAAVDLQTQVSVPSQSGDSESQQTQESQSGKSESEQVSGASGTGFRTASANSRVTSSLRITLQTDGASGDGKSS